MLTKEAMQKGRETPRMIRFSEADLAAAAGVSVECMRKDRTRGKVNPKDLMSVARYLIERTK